jgi:AcrR family transcriptional regulator
MTSARQEGASQSRQPSGRVERRRARVRRRILEAAAELVHSRGIETVTVEEITEAADIARRSFYHHFDSKNEALLPVARARAEELNRRFDRSTEGLQDPAEIISIALRHTLRRIPEDPLCAWFIFRSGLPHERLREAIGESGARDLTHGIEQGRFAIANRKTVESLMVSATIGLLSGRLHGGLDEADLDDGVEHVLRLLGVPMDEAAEIAHRPLAPLPDD